jgi:hypothetical protein
MKKILFLAIIGLTYFSIYSFKCGNEIIGNGKKIEKELTGLSDFNSIANGAFADIEITKGDTYKVVFIGDENILDMIKVKVEGKSLNFETEGYNYSIAERSKAKFLVTMPTLEDVALGGSGSIVAKSDFDSEKISVAVGGSGDIKLRGKAKYQEVAIGGSGDVDLSDLEGREGEISIGGSGNVKINVSDKLEVAIAGSGDVEYQGNPNLSESIAGSGEVKKRR